MDQRPRSPRLASTFACALAIVACTTGKPAASSVPSDPSPPPSPSEASEADRAGEVGGAEPIGKELPPELVADLREQGSDADGRLLTLASGFIATAACSDCGAPNYLWFLAVRCADTRHCEVLTEQCEGEISREDQRFVLDFEPVEGGSAELCSGYSGTFELP